MPEQHDMVIIGGGPGGYVAAVRARQLGLSVALIERDRIGGVCLNRGCIPTKTLLSDMEGVRWALRATKDGILRSLPEIDFARLMHRKNQVVENLVSNLEKHLDGLGVKIIRAAGTIREPGLVTTDSGETVRTGNIVVATGATPWAPPIPGIDLPGVMGTTDILALERLPEHLLIIGAGIIGQEFASIFSTVGCRVTILEAMNRILAEADSEIARRYSSLLPARGITTELGVTIHRIEKNRDRFRVVYEKKTDEKTVEADAVLVATGRRPAWSGVGIEELGIHVENGAIHVDRFLKTSVEGIYAIGDVIGPPMLAHAASYEGEVVAENVAGSLRPWDGDPVPCAVFTIPQIAWVGLTEEQARDKQRPFRTSMFSLSASGKAMAMGDTRGWIKLIEDIQTRRLVGAHMMGPHVSELLGELTLAIRKQMSASDIADTIHAHPTISEALREAALGFLDGPIYSLGRTRLFDSG